MEREREFQSLFNWVISSAVKVLKLLAQDPIMSVWIQNIGNTIQDIILISQVWGLDKNHTGLSPHQPCVSSGLVFSSDQDCSEDYLVTGPMVGTYFSHGFGLYSCIFGVYPRLQWFPKLYTNLLHDCAMLCNDPIVANIALCMIPLQDQWSVCRKYRTL